MFLVLHRTRASVTELLGDRSNTLPGDASSLFDSQWVVRWFQFNSRDQPDRTGVHQSFQIERLGIARERGGEPAQIGRLLCSRFVEPQRPCPGEICCTQGYPHRIEKELSGPLVRNLEMPSHKKSV